MEIGANQLAVARRGREPGLRLHRAGNSVALKDWGRDLLDRLEPLCGLLDGADPTRPYSDSLAIQRRAMEDPDRTPSARVLKDMRGRGESFFQFAKRLSEMHRDSFMAHPLPDNTERAMTAEAKASLQGQAAIEAADTLSFGEYLHRYFSQT
jgi:glutamate--cysteine ligase